MHKVTKDLKGFNPPRRTFKVSSYLSAMKHFFGIAILTLTLFACSETPEADSAATTDSAAIPDSVPQRVIVGKEAGWAYKPDTMINDLLLGDAKSLSDWKRINGNEGVENSGKSEMVYVNSLETEQLTVYQIVGKSATVAYGFRVKKNVRDKNSPPASNYSIDRNFLTSAGIYIGMPPDYVQSIYKSQPMMRWVKMDTTYLSYAPEEKDKEHYKRYSIEDYRASYKFVNDKCVLMEVFVNANAFAE
jgi:hypothetical protein